MKNVQSSLGVGAAIFAALLSIQNVPAATITWNNGAGGNWSVDGNWSPATAPTQADDAVFGVTGTGSVNTMDANRTVNSLTYNQNNGGTHSTSVSAGQVLMINRTNSGDVLYVGAANAAIAVPVNVSGSGGLNLNGAGDLVIRQGNSANGSQRATLDLSGLDTLDASVGRLLVGQANAGAAVNRPTGTLLLAKTNHITLSGAAPQVMIQDSGQNANGSSASILSFGQETHLYAASMRFGGQKGVATINFNGAFSSPSLELKNSDIFNPISLIVVGDNPAGSASGNSTTATMDLSPGTVDIWVDTMYVGRGQPLPGTGGSTGSLSIGAGICDANTLEIGYLQTNSAATGTLNVNNNFLFSTGAVVNVNNFLRLARTNGFSSSATGTLNVNGGTIVANSIVAGGGNSTINLGYGSTLVISNIAGTLANPIQNFSTSDATLNIPVSNAGATIAVKTLTTSGSQNVINITTIPPISSYPATFTLISSLPNGFSGNFALGTLPNATPNYVGSIVDAGDGFVKLTLTGGPVVDLSMRWTAGAGNSSWDSFSFNWLYQGNPSAYFNGAAVLFDDTATLSNIYLAEVLSPGSVTVSNNVLEYEFGGTGNIGGASILTKAGSKKLIVDHPGTDNYGTVLIKAGTLQIGNGGTDGNISAITITNNGALVVNRSDALALSSAIAGTGTLTKSGGGTLTLSGDSTYSGATTLSEGALQIDGALSGGGSLNTASGTLLAGGGTIDGAVTSAGQINPGSTSPGILKAHGGLTLSSGAGLGFDLSATDPFNPAANDAIEVFGNLAANNNKLTVNIAGTPIIGTSYNLLTYSGSLIGNLNTNVVGTHFPTSLNTNGGYVTLYIAGDSGSALKWNSSSDGAWDTTSTNWLVLSNSSPSLFFSGDTVLLDDTASVVTTITIGPGVTVYPAAITNDSANNNFVINGSGKIGGSASIIKTNTGTLAIGTANNFTGPVDIQAGTLRTDNDSALGTGSSGTTIRDGATLDLNGHNLSGETITVSGAGVGGNGAIVNSGGNQNQAFRQIALAGNTTFGGNGLWAMNNGGGAASLSTGGNAYNLTKVGTNQVNLAQLTTVDAALADIDIQQGTIEFSGLTSSMGDPSRTNYVRAGATLSFANSSAAWNKYFVLIGNGTNTTVSVGTGANSRMDGPIELHGNVIFNVTGTALVVSNIISGDGGLTKNGSSPMILSNTATYTGDTRINTGALRINDVASFAMSSNIIINAGATLTATGRVDATFTLAANQTLKGNGVINGIVVANPNSTISPGIDAVGALTISNAVTLSGTISMDLDQNNATNDMLRSNSSITYGGTLNLVNLGGTFTNGASFKLFNASSYPGMFSGINPPTPGPGQTWNTNALGTTGTISVSGSAVVSVPRFNSVVVQGSNLIMSGTNGTVSGNYYVLASTNVSLPLSNWTRIATNSFNGSGNFSFTNSINPALPRNFFLLQLP